MSDRLTFKTLRDMVQTSEPCIVVTFKKPIEDYESYFDCGMRASLIRVETDVHGGINVAKFVFSVKDFDVYNMAFEQHNYYDEHGEACLNAREANMHPERTNWVETVYFDLNMFVDEILTIEPTEHTKLHNEFRSVKDQIELTYTEWLEAELIKARGK